jgi:tape measure domain-containing protein
MPDFRVMVAKFQSDITGIDSGIQQANSKLDAFEREQQSKYGALQSRMKSVGTAMSLAVTAPIVYAGKEAVDAYKEMDSLKRGLTVVMGGATEARKELDKLREVAKLPGLGLSEAIEGSVALQAVGESAKEARDLMMGFGNALATVGKGKNELNAVMEQVKQSLSIGKVMTADIRIIRQYVPQMSAAMKALFGTSNSEEIAKMGVSSEEFFSKLTAYLLKMPKMTTGFKNDLENMSDDVKIALADAGEAIAPFVSDVAKGISTAAKTFSEMSDGEKKVVIGALAVAAALGPVMVAVKGVTDTYALLSIARATNATKTVVESAAEVANTTVKAANATAATGLAVAEGRLTTAIVAQTAAVSANTSAWASMLALMATPVSAAAVGTVAGIGIGVTAGLGYGIYKFKKESAEARKQIRSDRTEEDKFFQSTYSKHSTDQLERDLARQKELREEARVFLRQYDKMSWRQKWMHQEQRDEEEDNYNRANRRVIWLKKELEKRQQSTELQKKLTEEQQKAIAENEKANLAARRESWVLSQTSESAKEQAQAWVDYKKATEDILEKQKKTFDDTGLMLDVSDQIAAAKAAYTDKLKDIQAEEQKQADATTARVQAAKLQISAVQASNDYERQILEEQASLVTTLQSLRSQDATVEELELARTQSAKRIADIKQKQVDEWQRAALNNVVSSARARAIGSGDELAQANVDAAEEYLRSYQEAAELYKKGLPYQGLLDEAYARLKKKHSDNVNTAAEKMIEKAEQAKAQSLLERTAALEAQAIGSENKGDTVGSAHARALIEQMNTASQLNELRDKGVDVTERANLANAKYLKTIKEAQDQVVRAEAGAVQAKIDEIRREDKEREELYQREIERRKSLVGFISLEEYGKKAMISGLTTRFQPFVPSRDTSYPASPGEVERAISVLREEQIQTNRKMDDLIRAVQNLGGKPRRI